jgi:hypothetical protein
MKVRNPLCLLAVLTIAGSGCAPERVRPVEEAQTPPRPAPVLVPATPAQLAAERAYKTCLARAVMFARNKLPPSGNMAFVIAPICYSLFSDFEAAMAGSVAGEDREAYERGADRRQLDYAQEAVRESRDTALSASR